MGAKVKNLDNQISFERFAQTMNNNAMVDMPNANLERQLPDVGMHTIDNGGQQGNALPGPTTPPNATNTQTEAPAVTPTTAQGLSTVPSVSGAKKTEEEWMTEGGYDPDNDYINAKNQLEYDYMQSSANYGSTAEQLAQMGLTGSGVSDVFQLGAYQSYIQGQNDLYKALVKQKNELRQQYNQYSDTYDANAKADTANAYNFGLNMYNGANADEVRRQLTAQGYDASIVDTAVANLEALDKNSLPTVKAAEEEKGRLYETAYAMMEEGSTAQEVRDYMIKSGANADYVNEVMTRLSDKESLFTDKAISAGVAAVKELFMREIEDADGNKSTTNVFKGSNDDIETVRQALRGSKYEKYTDQIIDQLKIDKHNQTAAQYDDLIAEMNSNIDSDTALYSASDIKQIYSSAPIKKQKEIAAVATKQADKVLNDQTAFSNAYAFVGVDKATWDQTDDGDKMLMVLDRIGGLKNTGAISSETSDKYFREWVEDQMVQIERQEDRDALVEQIQTFADKGYISSADELKKLVENTSTYSVSPEVTIQNITRPDGMNVMEFAVSGGKKIAVGEFVVNKNTLERVRNAISNGTASTFTKESVTLVYLDEKSYLVNNDNGTVLTLKGSTDDDKRGNAAIINWLREGSPEDTKAKEAAKTVKQNSNKDSSHSPESTFAKYGAASKPAANPTGKIG